MLSASSVLDLAGSLGTSQSAKAGLRVKRKARLSGSQRDEGKTAPVVLAVVRSWCKTDVQVGLALQEFNSLIASHRRQLVYDCSSGRY